VASARSALVFAAQANDLEGFLRHIAPGAKLIVGTDTVDLRERAAALYRDLRPDPVTRAWMVGSRLRPCNRWVYETGGEAGYTAGAPGTQQMRLRWRYSIAWASDDSGNAVVHTMALVQRDYAPPSIEGCWPTARQLFERRRAGIAVMPSAGIAYTGVPGAVESGMRARGVTPQASGGVGGFERHGSLAAPVLAAAWFNLTPRLSIEAVATLATSSASAFGIDTAGALATGSRLDQRWAAVLASVRVADAWLGAGPAFVREAWHVSVEHVQAGPGETLILGEHIADAGNTLNRLGLYAQARVIVPFSSRTFVQVQAFSLLLSPSPAPAAFAVPAARVGSSVFGIGLLLGVGF
jgi:hypothetical protein